MQSIPAPQFPNIEDSENDSDQILKIILDWMNEIFDYDHKENLNDSEVDENSNVIQKIDDNIHIVKEVEQFDASNIFDLLNYKPKPETQPFKLDIKNDNRDMDDFYKRFVKLISQFIEMRSPLIQYLTKDFVKQKMVNDLKQIVNIAIKNFQFNLSDTLNGLNLRNCLFRLDHKNDNDQSDKDLDILDNMYDLSNDNNTLFE